LLSAFRNNDKSFKNKELSKFRNIAYKPAYKQNPKAENQSKIDTKNLSADLAEIIRLWPNQPEHIKAAIKALVQTYIQEG